MEGVCKEQGARSGSRLGGGGHVRSRYFGLIESAFLYRNMYLRQRRGGSRYSTRK